MVHNVRVNTSDWSRMPVGDFFEERHIEVHTQGLNINILLNIGRGWWTSCSFLMGFGDSQTSDGSEVLVACMNFSCNNVFLLTSGLTVGTKTLNRDPIQDSGNYWESGPDLETLEGQDQRKSPQVESRQLLLLFLKI